MTDSDRLRDLAGLAERLDQENARLRAELDCGAPAETRAAGTLCGKVARDGLTDCAACSLAWALRERDAAKREADILYENGPELVARIRLKLDASEAARADAIAALSACAPTVCASDYAEGCGCLFHRARAVLDAPDAGRAIALADILRRAPGVLLALASPWGPLDADGRASVRLLLDLHLAGYDPLGGWTEPQIANMRSALERQ